MIDIENYISQLMKSLNIQFGPRLLYVGLQGSYLRGEATDHSDIDIMVIIEGLKACDLEHYRVIIQSLGHFEKSCGFICSKTDLANWNPLELHHLLSTTKDYHGALRDYIPPYGQQDIRNFVKLSINNLYHEICHRYIHAECNKQISALAGSYKGVFFILQNLYYLQCGNFIATKGELLPLLDGLNRAVLERSIELSNGIHHDFQESFELLFSWWIRYNKLRKLKKA